MAAAYFKLTRSFFEQLHPGDDIPRSKQFFQISMSLEDHTHQLADVIVHTLVAAQRFGITVAELQPENTVCLRLGNAEQKPDRCVPPWGVWMLLAKQ